MTDYKNITCDEDIPFDFTEEDIQSLNLRELAGYEARIPMTPAEKRLLRRWVASGHSVYEHPGSRYFCLHGAYPPPDFLSVYRMDREMERKLKDRTRQEKERYLKAYLGHTEENPTEELERITTEGASEQIKSHIRKLQRELFHIWDYIGREGLWDEAREYVDERKDDPSPFEW